jgi:hypothetical protein
VKPLLAVLVCVAIVGCTTTARMNTPEGFAHYEESEEFRLITAEGIVLRARVESNSPHQSLEFWAEALGSHLSSSGYVLLEQSGFDADSVDGVLFEWLAPVGEDDWIYMTAIVVVENEIVVVESAGPHDQYRAYREAIRASLSSVVIERTVR